MAGSRRYRHSWITVGRSGRLIWRCLKCGMECSWRDTKPDGKTCHVPNVGSSVQVARTRTALKQVRGIRVFGERLLRLMDSVAGGKTALKVLGKQQKSGTGKTASQPEVRRKGRGSTDSSVVEARVPAKVKTVSGPKRKPQRARTVLSMTGDYTPRAKSGGSTGRWSDQTRTPTYWHGGE